MDNPIDDLKRKLADFVHDPDSCSCCGGKQVLIRGRHPGDDKRLVCPTCMRSRLDYIHDMSGPSYGIAASVGMEDK